MLVVIAPVASIRLSEKAVSVFALFCCLPNELRAHLPYNHLKLEAWLAGGHERSMRGINTQ